jgi:two-component system alkaline phosphatase synthesis response regulator PhoP
VTHILLIEDNHNLAVGLRNNLEVEGYEVSVAATGTEGLARARAIGPELVILDLMLPGLDGYRVLRTLREEGFDVPVLILSARGAEADKVLGFRHGADDYVTKPFGLLELLARIEALLRRAAGSVRRVEESLPDTMRYGAIEVRPGTHQVRRDGRPVSLRPKEYELLLALIHRRGKVATRVDLLHDVWGYGASVMSRTVDTHIGELRRKLEDDPSSPRHILTVWKTGYRWNG